MTARSDSTATMKTSLAPVNPRGATPMSLTSPASDTPPANQPRAVVSKKALEQPTCLMGIPLLDPRTSNFLVAWDCITLIALAFTALVTPFEISFLTDFSLVLFLLNRGIDGVFIFDMGVTFATMIPPSKDLTRSGGTQWETRPKAIAANYLKGWFTVDFVSIAVSAGDIASVSLPDNASDGVLMIIQLLRVVRLVKMVRLLRGFRMWKRWETRNAVNYSMLKLVSCLVTILVNSHWIACVWSLQTLFKTQRHESWLGRGNIDYCEPDAESGGTSCVPAFEVWAASMHFSIMTITSIGYGDIVPTDVSEQIVGLVLMLVAGVQWASTIGTLCAVLTESPETAQFHEDIDALNTYLEENSVATGLRQRLREFFHQAAALRRNKSTQTLLTQMPPSLLAELVLQTNGHWLNNIPLLRSPTETDDLSNLEGLDNGAASHRYFLVEVMLSLVSVVYSPEETVSSEYVAVITSGLAFRGLRVVGTGKSIGEDSLLAARHLRRPATVKAINYLTVYMIEPEAIWSLAAKYPLFKKVLRKRVVSLAFRRLMGQLAAEAKAKKDLAAGEKGSKLILALRRMQSSTDVPVTPPNHAYRAQQMLDPVIYDTVCMMAAEQSQMRQDLKAIMQRLDVGAAGGAARSAGNAKAPASEASAPTFAAPVPVPAALAAALPEGQLAAEMVNRRSSAPAHMVPRPRSPNGRSRSPSLYDPNPVQAAARDERLDLSAMEC